MRLDAPRRSASARVNVPSPEPMSAHVPGVAGTASRRSSTASCEFMMATIRCSLTSVAKKDDAETLTIDAREVRITHPGKPYFTKQVSLSKLDLVRYYLSVAPGALQGIRDRPIVLKRFVDGAEHEPFYQKRAPEQRPDWLRTVTLSVPSGRTAEEVVIDDASGLAWIVNLGCLELHRIPCAPRISIIPMSCASTRIRRRA